MYALLAPGQGAQMPRTSRGPLRSGRGHLVSAFPGDARWW